MRSNKHNSIWLGIQFIITLLTSLVGLKLNILNYGKEIFGVWLALASIWGFGTTLDFGFGLAIVKYVAEHKDDEKVINKLLSSVYFVFILLGVVIYIVCSLIAYFLYFYHSSIIHLDQIKNFQIIFLILGVSFFAQYLSFFYKSIIEGLNNFIVTSRILITQNLILFTGIVLIYFLKLDLIYLSFLYLLSFIFMLASFFAYFKLCVKKYFIGWKYFDIAEARRIFKFSSSIQLMNGFYSIINPLTVYMLSNNYSTQAVPMYEIARRFSLAISGLFFNIFKFILPKSSSLGSEEEVRLFIKNEILLYSRIGVTYSGVMFGIFILPLVFVINYFFGIRESIFIFIILALPESVNSFGYSIYNFMLGLGKASILAFIQFLNLLVTFGVLLIGFNLFNSLYGLLGYFISVVIGNIIMVMFVKNRFHISYSIILLNSKAYKLAILIIMLLFTSILFKTNLISDTILFISFSCISLLIFFNDIINLLKEYLPAKYTRYLKIS